jgi:hypothetical protein
MKYQSASLTSPLLLAPSRLSLALCSARRRSCSAVATCWSSSYSLRFFSILLHPRALCGEHRCARCPPKASAPSSPSGIHHPELIQVDTARLQAARSSTVHGQEPRAISSRAGASCGCALQLVGHDAPPCRHHWPAAARARRSLRVAKTNTGKKMN